MPLQKNWFVVQTKPCEERKVSFYLIQKRIETYLPKTEIHIYKGLRRAKKIKPLFPSYIFVRCEREKVYSVCWTKGVKKVLWNNTDPQPIPDDLIHSIKSLANKDGLIKQPKRYKPNDLVKITSGPFKDNFARFDHWESGKERVCLLLNTISAQIKVSMPAALMEVA